MTRNEMTAKLDKLSTTFIALYRDPSATQEERDIIKTSILRLEKEIDALDALDA